MDSRSIKAAKETIDALAHQGWAIQPRVRVAHKFYGGRDRRNQRYYEVKEKLAGHGFSDLHQWNYGYYQGEIVFFDFDSPY